MFGLVSRKRLDAALAEGARLAELCGERLGLCREYEQQRQEAVSEKLECLHRLCEETRIVADVQEVCERGGVREKIDTVAAVKELIGRVWLAGFNRGMLAERETKHHAA